MCDKEELMKEKLEDTTNVIKLKHLYSNNMKTRIVGVHTLRIDEDPQNNNYQRLK